MIGEEYHKVALILNEIPMTKRDYITTWLWDNIGPFDKWTMDGLFAAINATQSDYVVFNE